MIAEVIVNSSVNKLNRVFDYEVPKHIEIAIGARVLVPFSSRKKYEIGYVIGLKEDSKYKCKEIAKLVDYVFDEEHLELARWMSKRYFCNLAEVLRLLVPPGTTTNLEKVSIKTEKWAYLACEENEIENIKSNKQKRILQLLLDNGELPVSELLLFADTTRSVLMTLVKNGFVVLQENEVQRNPFASKEVKKSEDLVLNEEQKNAFEQVDRERYREYLLFGVTGSGKTEVYLQLIRKVLDEGRTAIVLVPEISLTPQITDRFLSRFGDIVAILHSRLSIGERYDEWRKIKEGSAKIVIGARSAIFAPMKNVGIIIIDEEHDASYKSENTPKYEVKEVASKLAKDYNIPLILGSATPDIGTYQKAQNGEISLIKLTKRVLDIGMPKIEVVDLRQELANGNKTVFSRHLYKEIEANLERKEQTILFLNRRGFSTFIMCRDCGYVVKCEKCNVSLTYHLTSNRLLCHYCGKEHKNVQVCPDCGSQNIRYFGTGTQRIEQEIHKYFPTASVIRMDVDTTRTKNAHEKILNRFREEKIDILLGTQMITKGHDFANVTLVGVLAADSSINVADYRANEKTYQLLTQVAGRAGRGDKKGRAIIQTYIPDEFSIQAVKEQDFEKFYANEINIREKLNYPPFCDIILCVLSGEDENCVKRKIQEVYDLFHDNFEVYPPIPAPISKINNQYRWRILIKTKINESNIALIQETLEAYEKIKVENVKFNLDINPNNML